MQTQNNPFTPLTFPTFFSQTKFFQAHPNHPLLIFAVTGCIWLLISGALHAQTAATSESSDVEGQRKAYGIVEEKAGESLVGHWAIGTDTYLVTFHTKVSENDAAPEIGDCVVVKYYGHGSVRVAKQIDAAEADLCVDAGKGDAENGDAKSGDAKSGDAKNGDAQEDESDQATMGDMEDEMPQKIEMHRGLLRTMPLNSLFGGWSVDMLKFVTDDETDFVQIDGSLLTGACVTIHYRGDRMPYTIVKIVAEEPDACMQPGTVDISPARPAYKDYGRLEALPDNAELPGEWTVNGVNYMVSKSTRIHKWYGQFTVGTCINVHYQGSEPPFNALKILTARQHHCGGQQDEEGFARGVLLGQLGEYPTTLTGDWNVGGMSFVVSTATNFDQRRGDFAEGVMVKVKFYVDEDGVNQATKVKTLFRLWQDENGESGDPDGGDSGYGGVTGHAFGSIDSYPNELVGAWTVGGIDYVADTETIFRQNAGDFAEGAIVRIRYYINDAGERAATLIKTSGGTATIPGRHRLCGYVGKLPTYGFAGDWLIDGINLQTEESAEFEETASLLGLGTYAEIEYGKHNGRYVIYKIKAHVPPSAGENNLIGTLRRVEGAALTGAGITPQDDERWEIGGQSYVVTPATDLDEQNGELFVGSTVAVNSYTDNDGNEVATQINVVTNSPASFLDNDFYLPLFTR